MEALGILFGILATLLFLATPVMVIVALVKLGQLQDEMSVVKKLLGGLKKAQPPAAKAEARKRGAMMADSQ